MYLWEMKQVGVDLRDLHGSYQEVDLDSGCSLLGSCWHRRVVAKQGNSGLCRGDRSICRIRCYMLELQVPTPFTLPFPLLSSWELEDEPLGGLSESW